MRPDRQGLVRRALIVLALSFLLTATVYRKTPMNFFRAESGWFLFHAYSDQESQHRFQRMFFTGSYGGHYTPLAFVAEFQIAKIAGVNESIWKWRQILVLALIGAGLAGAVYAIGGALELFSSARWIMAAAVTAGAIFSPEMLDFVSWPFMILQLVFVGLLVAALYSVFRVVVSPDQRQWPWLAAGAAYGSMHVSGLGLVTVAAVSVVFAGLLLIGFRLPSVPYRSARKHIGSAFAVMLGLSVAHGWAMLQLFSSQSTPISDLLSLCRLLLGFTAHLVISVSGTFLGTAISAPSAQAVGVSWPFGLLVIAGATLLLGKLLRSSLKDPAPLNLTRCLLHGFSVSAFLTLLGLVAVRQFYSSSLEVAATSLAVSASAPRYLVPLHFILVASAVELLARLARRAPRFSFGAFCGIALAAMAAQLDYRWNTFPYVAPLARISHASAWNLIVATVRECRAAKLPVPAVPLGSLTQEFFDWDPKMFEPLLRRELRLAPKQQIEMIAWQEYLRSDRVPYHTSAPSLQLLKKKLAIPEE